MIAKPLGFVNPPMRLGLSLDCSGAAVTVARCLPLVTLCASATSEDCSDAGVAAGVVEREASNGGEVGATAASAEGADSPSTIDPPLARASAGGADGLALALRGEEVGPREDPFAWPHPADPHEALFVVDDIAERAAWASASQSHEGVLLTLSKLVDAAAVVTELGMEA